MSAKINNETKKEIAKIAMTACLGTVVATASFARRNKKVKNVHTGAGVLLVGFSLWHHMLYQPEKKAARARVSQSEKSKAVQQKTDLSKN